VQVGEDLRTYIEMAVAPGLGPCRRFVCASMEIAAGKFERSDRAGEFWKRREGFGANLARRVMVHSCGRNWRGASREAMRVRRHGRGNEAISAAGRGVNGFDGRCGLNAGV
jgi:hypothetical protein